MSNKFNKLQISIAAALLAMGSAHVAAGGFGIATQSGSGTGNAFAGGAAVADDASVVWSNPAGMTALPLGKHVTGAAHIIRPSFKYTDGGSTGAFGSPPSSAANGGDGGDWAYIPNGFFSMDITPALRFGVALNAPFGLKTEYDVGWRGQLTAIKSDIKTVNIQPSIAYKINELVSIGAGVSYQRIEAELTSSANLAGTNLFTLKAKDHSWGFNVGATIQPAQGTRIGLHYRSSIKYKLDGTATFSTAGVANGPASADLKVPDSASLSVLHQVTPQLELMGDVTWTKWSSVQELRVFTTNPLGPVPVQTFAWSDTWRFGLGANYRLNSQWKLRTGVALDKTPTNDAFRTPRLPDQDRTWLSFGVQYKPFKQGTFEFGYAHEFVKNATVNAPPPAGAFATCGASCLRGTFKDKADIISLQYSHVF